MKNHTTLCILQLIISSVFLVKISFGGVTQACLDEIIKANIMLKALTVTKTDTNWNGKLKEHELRRYDFDFKNLIPKEDKIEEITNRLVKDCQGKRIFARTLIPTENEPALDRLNRESKIQKVAGFNNNLFKRLDTDIRNLNMKDRRKLYSEEINNKKKRQRPADKIEYDSAVAERKEVLYDYINKEMGNRKNIQMCKPDSTKCILLGLRKTLDALPDWFNYTAKCDGDICRISMKQHCEKTITISSDYIDENNSDGEYEPIELTTGEASTSEITEGNYVIQWIHYR
ncbi:uncharacterized protein LOC126840562 isoform X2 [Adelges cooleyi]|uniref:uncharacterized protein LOC126840562 isoform X2 n=1 Tax=Adelges cooleyi TaxID=133065 RepID=UPI00217FD744|nr:uncharacterized protein LOC126840562 isoform X2 [Adelges cooleyi]